MCGNNGNLGNVCIRIVEDELTDVVCGNAGVFGLREAVVADLDLIVIVEALNDLAALTDIDDCSSPLAVLAIVEEVALDKHVASAAALVPLEGIGFKLDGRSAAVKVVVGNLDMPLGGDQHTAGAVIADQIAADVGLGLVGEILYDHALGDLALCFGQRQHGGIGIDNLDCRNGSKTDRHLVFGIHHLDAVTDGVNVNAAAINPQHE